MLEIRPTCENCNKNLPANSLEACICSYECTFCRACVEGVLRGVCPNCGGGFVNRPVRPKTEWRKGVSVMRQLPHADPVLKPVDVVEHKVFSAKISTISPENR